MTMLFSIPCYAKETSEVNPAEVSENEFDPRIEVWNAIRTTSGEIVIPAGTYIPGASSYYVRLAQTILNTLGYNCGSVDGIYGTNTKNAIINFQTSVGTTADGIIGKNTWARFRKKLDDANIVVSF